MLSRKSAGDEAITTPAEESVRRAAESGPVPLRLQQAVIANQNVFEVLVDAVRCCSLGQDPPQGRAKPGQRARKPLRSGLKRGSRALAGCVALEWVQV